MIQAVIYDMDGVIIDSEPLWREAEIRSFALVGINLTPEMCGETTGLRVDEVVHYWQERFPHIQIEPEATERSIWDGVIALVKERGEIKEGVHESLEFVRAKHIPLALASTSAMVLINTVLDKLQLTPYFSVVHSAEFEKRGKPDPAVYLTTANKLNVSPAACLAIEDSLNGIASAKAAGMTCVAVPESELLGNERLKAADAVITSLNEFDVRLWKRFNNPL
jgi:mannitol-1-/sugar-/sorbitol-6-/2-deoxyglucose-6-phosphatase